MDRTKKYLTDEELELLEDYRYEQKYKKAEQKAQLHPLVWQNRPYCDQEDCKRKAAPGIGAVTCTTHLKWIAKRLEYTKSLQLLYPIKSDAI